MGSQHLHDVDASGVDRRVPAECVLATRHGQLPGADLRVYQFHSHHTRVPPLRDIALIGWQTRTQISLRCGTIRSATQMSPWDFSILRPGHASDWQWNTGFRAAVLYLNEQRLADVAAEVFDRHVEHLRIRESFQVQDAVIQNGVAALVRELHAQDFGGVLYTQALMTQLCVHLLRRHADAQLREPRCPGALSAAQARQVADYIDAHLAGELSLAALARVAGMSPYHFARLFRKRFGAPPHAWVQQRRVERARHLLLHTDMALKQVAGIAGFYDQSHMAKSFRRALHVTPGALRAAR